MSIWQDLVDGGVIEGDATLYESGEASEADYKNAIEVAFKGTEPGSVLRKGLIDAVGIEGDVNYWYNLPSNSAEVSDLAARAKALDISSGGTQDEANIIKALPKNSRLINVNGENRVIWDLGEGLGHAWYTIDTSQLKDLFGEDWQAYVTETFGNEG